LASIPFTPSTWFQERPTILPEDGTSNKVLLDTDAAARQIDQLVATNGDAVPHHLSLFMKLDSDIRGIGAATIPGNAGYLGRPSIDLLALALPNPRERVVLPPGVQLIGFVDLAVGSGNSLDFTITGGKE